MMVAESQELLNALERKRAEATRRCHCGGIEDEHGLCLPCERNASEIWTEQDEADFERQMAQGE